MARPARTPSQADRTLTDRPVALLDGRAISWDDLVPRLAEMGGRRALEEVALERALTRACAAQGITVTRAGVDREGELLLETYLASGLAQTRSEAEALVQDVKRSRGLGPERFGALLRRNAMLRAIVRDDVTIDDASIQRAYALRFGPLYRARLIVTATREDAQRVLDELAGGASFGEVAARRSTDQSAARGGVIDDISPADQSWPTGVRAAVESMRPGDTSVPIAVEGGYAILRLDAVDRTTGGPPIDGVRAQLERDERLRQERVLMDQKASSMMASLDLVVLDDRFGS